MPLIIALLIIVGIIYFIASIIAEFILPIGIAIAIGAMGYALYELYCYLYFESRKFSELRDGIESHVDNCNKLNQHIEELKASYNSVKSYDYGNGDLSDASLYNYNRDEWKNFIRNSQTHNCSAAVLNNVKNQPIKYLCKYFDIGATEESLSFFEATLNNFAAAEQGKQLLKNERGEILDSVKESIPGPILWFRPDRLMKKLGFEPIELNDLHIPTYAFQYISIGGKSSAKYEIRLNVENLDVLVGYLSGLVKFRKSVKGQRALMTSGLREYIKKRDGYSCRLCGISVSDEANILLEIDHIIPLSKGGVTTEANLQTLCWRCNRSKGSKINYN